MAVCLQMSQTGILFLNILESALLYLIQNDGFIFFKTASIFLIGWICFAEVARQHCPRRPACESQAVVTGVTAGRPEQAR